jgi:predicted dehydrogenase
MSNFRVAILGCGQVSPDHLVAWSRAKGATLVAACDPMKARAEQRAQEYGIPAAYDSPREMFEREKPDLVDIITPRETHADMVRLAAEYGIHALCEKPLCPTLAEAEALVREVEPKIRLMVNENWRYRDYYRQIGRWIGEGKLGTLTHYRIALIRSNMLRDADGVVIALKRQPFMAKEERMLIAECLIHELDVTRSLLGEMDVVASRIGRGTDVLVGEDTASILLETKRGMPVVVEGALCAAGHHVRAGDRLELTGTRGSVILDNAVLKLIGSTQAEQAYDEVVARQQCFDSSIQHFIDSMQSGQPFWTSGKDQLETLRLVEDAYRLAGRLRVLA